MISVFGLGGVAMNETPSALRWAARFEYPMLLVALWVMVEWYLTTNELIGDETRVVTDWLVWSLFSGETLVLTCLVRNKFLYLRSNWINLLIVIIGFPVFWEAYPGGGGPEVLRLIRLLALVSIFIHVFDTMRTILSRNQFGTTLVVIACVLVIFGLLMAGIDPGIADPMEGIYWAWVTITTVGYGDVVPHTPTGRFLAGILMLIGIVLVSIITANISAFFVARDKLRLDAEREARLMEKLDQQAQRLAHLEKEIQYLVRLQLESQGVDQDPPNPEDTTHQT